MDSSSEGLVGGLDSVRLGPFQGELGEAGTPRSCQGNLLRHLDERSELLRHLRVILSSYGDFFTPVGELGMALYEMWEVSALPMGSLPYEEYFSCEAELALLEKQELALFETYQELMCHFYICSDMHGNHKGASNSSKSWGDYLFPNLKNTPEEAQCGVADEDIFRRMKEHAQGDIV